MEYAECPRCQATVIRLRHYLTSSVIDIDPLPNGSGNIVPDFQNNLWRIVRKPAKGLWQAHVASCPVQP